MHKYCHLCKKHFDNYIRHINAKVHKDTSNKYSANSMTLKIYLKELIHIGIIKKRII